VLTISAPEKNYCLLHKQNNATKMEEEYKQVKRDDMDRKRDRKEEDGKKDGKAGGQQLSKFAVGFLLNAVKHFCSTLWAQAIMDWYHGEPTNATGALYAFFVFTAACIIENLLRNWL